eukprot:TRINITY_DN39719_c0_g1_i1.p2 TRINITY_DN39719_c0_g1~~TRINITY_DN39719_c0_g1_i1.p2  ORF type:complete len:165 (+),score=49.47 TRINITY_DN39719_c0_g1_i1:62-496(+)
MAARATSLLFLRASSAAPVALRHPQLQSALGLAARTFCAATAKGSLEDRVIAAVKKYAAMRVEELKREEADAASADERSKLLAALGGDVTADTKWEDLGFDDLDKVEVLLEVEDEFSHTMPDDEADAISSVKETIAYLQKQKIE